MGVGVCINCLRAEEELKEAQARILGLQGELTSLEAQLAELTKLVELQACDLERLRKERQEAETSRNQPERAHPDQLALAFERIAEALAKQGLKEIIEPLPDPSENEGDSPKKKRKRGRRRLAEQDLEVIEERIVPPEVRACDGRGWKCIAEEVSERIAYQPGRFVRIRLVREKWVRCDEQDRWLDAPVTAPLPEWAIPGLMADTSVIASILVAKYGFALPLHRQEQMIALEGFPIARSTMSDWTETAHALAAPVVLAMHAESLVESYCIATDATSAPVRVSDGTVNHHVFVFIADAGHITFLASRRHDGDAIRGMLGSFRGALLSDAAGIYSVVHALGTLFVACWAHVRRYFWKATLSEPALAYEALALIKRIFEIEHRVKRLPSGERAPYRLEHTQPVIDLMDAWAEQTAPKAEPGGRMETALRYYRNQREALGHFIHDGRLEADNNGSERQLRALVQGRKNWMHFENKTGLEWYTVFRSLISSCQLHQLNPYTYLEEMLRLARTWPADRMLELSPKYWRTTISGLSEPQQEILHPPWKAERARPPPPLITSAR